MNSFYEKVMGDLNKSSRYPAYKKDDRVLFLGERKHEPATVWGHDPQAYMDALGLILSFDNYPSMAPMTVHPRWVRSFPLSRDQVRKQLRVIKND